MTGRSLLSVGEIEQMLEGRMLSLAAELLPNGRKEGHEWVVGSLAGEAGRSLAVHLDGARAGWWKDFASGKGGDALKLVSAVLFGDDLGSAVAWAKSWLGIDDRDPARLRQHRLEAQAAGEKRAREVDREREAIRGSAIARWIEGRSIIDTPAEWYLATRGIDLSVLGKAPGALRFHPALRYGRGRDAPTPCAMVAGIIGLDGRQRAIHRTWLTPDGSGKAGPAQGVDGKPKKTLGDYQGGHIPLWKGAAGRATLRDVPEGTMVVASEGIEDGLTAACADPDARVICIVALANLAHLELPPQIGGLVFLAQNDPAGSPAEAALQRGVASLRARGVRVLLARPPAGVKDVNELLGKAA